MTHRFRHVRWIVLLSAVLVCVLGCRPANLLASAAISQSAQWPARGGAPGQWTFRGLDPRVPPRIRPGSYATATHSVHFLDASSLGPHSYRFLWSERNGIAYACRAGHLDVAHARKAADWTGYLAAVTLRNLEGDHTAFQFRGIEPSVYSVTLVFPPDWDRLEEADRERVARDVSRELGQYLSFTALTWHEILTWFGYRPRPHVSEFPSAFSWEDSYSNLLGVLAAGAALENESLSFSEAVTGAFARLIEELGGQPAEVARRAAQSQRGRWYSKKRFSTVVHKRNFDVGLDDGFVTPCLVPGVDVCEGQAPLPLAVPTLEALARHGFSAHVQIEPRVWEQKKILAALADEGCPPAKRLDPAVHFPFLLRYCQRHADVVD